MLPADDNHFIIHVPVEVKPPFFALITTFGRGAEILAPASVVDGVKQFLRKAADMYKEAEGT